MKIANYSEVRSNLKSYLDMVIDDNDMVIVNRSKGKAAVILSLEEYSAMQETEYLMSSKKMMDVIDRGLEDIKLGRGMAKRENESMEEFLKRLKGE
jgi:antitoxin YefM